MVSAEDGTILLGGSKNRGAFGELKAVLDKHSNEIQEIKGVLKKNHQIGKKKHSKEPQKQVKDLIQQKRETWNKEMEDLTERIIFKNCDVEELFIFYKKQKEEMPNYLNILQIFPNQLSEKALAQPHTAENSSFFINLILKLIPQVERRDDTLRKNMKLIGFFYAILANIRLLYYHPLQSIKSDLKSSLLFTPMLFSTNAAFIHYKILKYKMNEEKGLQKLEKCFEKYTCLQNAQKFVPTFRMLLAILAYEIYFISIKKDNTKAKKWLAIGDQLCNSISNKMFPIVNCVQYLFLKEYNDIKPVEDQKNFQYRLRVHKQSIDEMKCVSHKTAWAYEIMYPFLGNSHSNIPLLLQTSNHQDHFLNNVIVNDSDNKREFFFTESEVEELNKAFSEPSISDLSDGTKLKVGNVVAVIENGEIKYKNTSFETIEKYLEYIGKQEMNSSHFLIRGEDKKVKRMDSFFTNVNHQRSSRANEIISKKIKDLPAQFISICTMTKKKVIQILCDEDNKKVIENFVSPEISFNFEFSVLATRTEFTLEHLHKDTSGDVGSIGLILVDNNKDHYILTAKHVLDADIISVHIDNTEYDLSIDQCYEELNIGIAKMLHYQCSCNGFEVESNFPEVSSEVFKFGKQTYLTTGTYLGTATIERNGKTYDDFCMVESLVGKKFSEPGDSGSAYFFATTRGPQPWDILYCVPFAIHVLGVITVPGLKLYTNSHYSRYCSLHCIKWNC